MSLKNATGAPDETIDRPVLTYMLHMFRAIEKYTLSGGDWKITDFRTTSQDIDSLRMEGTFFNKSSLSKVPFILLSDVKVLSEVVKPEWYLKFDKNSVICCALEKSALIAQMLYHDNYSSQLKWVINDNVIEIEPEEETVATRDTMSTAEGMHANEAGDAPVPDMLPKGLNHDIVDLAMKVSQAFVFKMDNSHSREFLVTVLDKLIALAGLDDFVFTKLLDTNLHSEDKIEVKESPESSSSATSHRSSCMEISSIGVSTDDNSSYRHARKRKKISLSSKAKNKIHSDLCVIQFIAHSKKFVPILIVEINSGGSMPGYLTRLIKKMLEAIEDKNEMFGLLMSFTNAYLLRLHVVKNPPVSSGKKVLKLAYLVTSFQPDSIKDSLVVLYKNIAAIINYSHKMNVMQK